MDLSLNLKAVISQRLLPLREGKGRARRRSTAQLAIDFRPDLQGRGPRDQGGHEEVARAWHADFDQALFDLYEAGRISYEDALRFAIPPTRSGCRSSCKARKRRTGPQQGHRAPRYRLS